MAGSPFTEQDIRNVRIIGWSGLVICCVVVLVFALVNLLSNHPSTSKHDIEADLYRQHFEEEIKTCTAKGGVPIRDLFGVKLKDCKFPPGVATK
jgi:hypothetical protein